MANWQFDDQERVNVGIDVGWSEKKKSCALAIEGLALTAGMPGWTSYQGKGRPVAVGLFRYTELLAMAADLIRSLLPRCSVTVVLDGPLGPKGRPSGNRRVDGEFTREPFRGRMQPSPVATGDGPRYAEVTDRLAKTLHDAAGSVYRAGWWDGRPAGKLTCCETHPTVGLALLLPPQEVDSLPTRKRPRRLMQDGPWVRAKSDWYWQLGAGRWVAEEMACPAVASETHHERVAGLYCLAVATRLSAHQSEVPTVAAVGGPDGVYVVPSVVDRGWVHGLRRVGVHAGQLLPQDQARFVTAARKLPAVASSGPTDTGSQEIDSDEAEKGDAATLILNDNGGIWEQHNDWLLGLTSPVYVRTEDEHRQTIRINQVGGAGQWGVKKAEHRPKQLASLRGFQGLHLSGDAAWAIPITLIDDPPSEDRPAVGPQARPADDAAG
jgi:hypothetical protein